MPVLKRGECLCKYRLTLCSSLFQQHWIKIILIHTHVNENRFGTLLVLRFCFHITFSKTSEKLNAGTSVELSKAFGGKSGFQGKKAVLYLQCLYIRVQK